MRFQQMLAAQGIDMVIRQCNVSVNRARHTLRGMHYQSDPHAEARIVSCARGALFETLMENTEVHYQMSAFYEPSAAKGVRWDDPAFGIRWPAPPQAISDRDRGYPDFGIWPS